MASRIKGSIASKISGYEDLLAGLVAEACVDVCPTNPHNFNVDNVRVVKLQGGGLPDSQVVKGMVLKRGTEGTVTLVENAKVAAYSQAVDTSSTDTKGTVLIKNAEELENYSKCVVHCIAFFEMGKHVEICPRGRLLNARMHECMQRMPDLNLVWLARLDVTNLPDLHMSMQLATHKPS